jgi:hypothetical protein
VYTPSLEQFRAAARRGNLVPVFREILADEDTPVSLLETEKLSGRFPILGVCLGHQTIGQAFGGKLVRARTDLELSAGARKAVGPDAALELLCS